MNIRIKLDIDDIEFKIAEVKREFVQYILNTEIPLEERWEFFKTAPGYLKEHQSWVQHFKVLDDNGVEFYDDLGLEKYETVATWSLVDRVLDCTSEGRFPNVKVNELKEDILSRNLGSFCNNW